MGPSLPVGEAKLGEPTLYAVQVVMVQLLRSANRRTRSPAQPELLEFPQAPLYVKRQPPQPTPRNILAEPAPHRTESLDR